VHKLVNSKITGYLIVKSIEKKKHIVFYEQFI